MSRDEPPADFRSQISVFQIFAIVLALAMVIGATSQIIHDEHDNQPTLILAGGLLIIALIIALFVLMSRVKSRAVSQTRRIATGPARRSSRICRKRTGELEQFVYITSHDLKTPIRGIGGLTQMLKEDLEEYCRTPNANPQVAKNLDHIQERVDRMNDLIEGVLEYSRVNAGKDNDSVIMMTEAVDAMVSDFGLSPGRLRLDGSLETVQFDTSNFRRVLENLVGNAIKHHHDPAALSITIRAEADGNTGLFTVKDNGPGIDPRFHERVFQVFQTVRDGNTPESTGIGLAIVKKLVEQHGGKVTLTSRLGAGAEFRFEWPLRSTAGTGSGAGHQRAA